MVKYALLLIALIFSQSKPAIAIEGDGAKQEVINLTESRGLDGWSLALYGAQWANSNLPPFLYNTVTGKMSFENAFLASLIVSKPFYEFAVPIPWSKYQLGGFTLEAEAQLIKHFEMQTHWETTLALVVKSGVIDLPGGLGSTIALGNGFSYAFSDPKYEKNDEGIIGKDTNRLQYHLSFEVAFFHEKLPKADLFVRLHHRSGIYGLISERRTGSNYLGVGLRYHFD